MSQDSIGLKNSSTLLQPPKSNENLHDSSSHSSVSSTPLGDPPYLSTRSKYFKYTGAYPKLKKATSLEEIYIYRKKSKKHRHELRRKSELIFREHEVSVGKRSSSKRLKSKQNRSYALGSGVENEVSHFSLFDHHSRRCSAYSDTGSKKSIHTSHEARKFSRQISKEESQRRKRRKKIINIILGVYFFLFCVSILCVVVTLTHKSTSVVSGNNNVTKNLTYYTFSPNRHVSYEDNR